MPLMIAATEDGRAEEAEQIAIEAVRQVAAHNADPRGLCSANAFVVPMALSAGDLEVAAVYAEEALALARKTRNPSALALALACVGWARARTEPDRAYEPTKEALDLVEGGARLASLPHTLSTMARLHVERGELHEAARVTLATLREEHARGVRPFFVFSVQQAIPTLAALGEQETAATMLGMTTAAMAGFTEEVLAPSEPGDSEARVRAELGHDAFQRAHDRGAAMEYDEAVGYALTELQRIAVTST
jgi:hypothetical protein